MARTEPVIMVTVIPEGSPAVRVNLSDRILEFEYEDEEAKADRLRLTVDNFDLSNFDDPIWRKGNFVEVTWGYPEALAPMRRCQIRSVTGFQKLKIEALGKEMTLNTIVKSRVFEHMTRSQVVAKIAAEQGFRSPDVLHLEDTEVVYPSIVQARLTDAQFIRRLAHKEGCEWYIDFDGFHFHRRDVTQVPLRVLEWREATDNNTELEITSINVENDVTARPGKVLLKGHNSGKRDGIAAPFSHESPPSHSTVLGLINEAPGTDSPPVPGFKAIAQETTHTTTETDPKAVARAAAAIFRRHQQMAVQITLDMVGDPNMLAKSVVALRGVGKRLSQSYYVRSVKHSIKSGYTCQLKMVSDGSGGHSTKSKLAHEASAVQVGPHLKGKRGPSAGPRAGIDAPLHENKKTDADGKPVTTYVDHRHRRPSH